MADSGVFKYIIEFFKKTDAVDKAREELKAMGDQGQEAAKGFGEKFKDAFASIRGGVVSVTRIIGTIAGAFGIVGLVIGAVMSIWDTYKGSQEKVIEATRKNLEEHTKLLDQYQALIKAGGTLTDSQRAYVETLQKTNEATREERIKHLESSVAVKEHEAVYGTFFGGLKEFGATLFGLTGTLEGVSRGHRDASIAAAGMRAELEALRAGASGETDRLAKQEEIARKNAELGKQQAAERETMRQRELAELDESIAEQDRIKQAQLDADIEREQKRAEVLLENDKLTSEERLTLLEESTARQLELLDSASQDLVINEVETVQRRLAISQDASNKSAKIMLEDGKKKNKVAMDNASMLLAIEGAVASKLVSMAAESGEKGKANARDYAREIVKVTAQAASTQILAWSAAKAAEKGIFTPLGIAYLVGGAALAATVAALGGVAARAIGGSGGASESPPGTETAGGGGGGFDNAPSTPTVGRLPTNEAQPANIIYISSFDGTIPPETLRNLDEMLNRRNRS